LGRQFENFKRGLIRVKLTDCIEKESEKEYQKKLKKGERERMKKHKEDQEREKMGHDTFSQEPIVPIPNNKYKAKEHARPCPIDLTVLNQIKEEDPRYKKNLDDIQIRSILSTN
jgi:hypothetical protein